MGLAGWGRWDEAAGAAGPLWECLSWRAGVPVPEPAGAGGCLWALPASAQPPVVRACLLLRTLCELCRHRGQEPRDGVALAGEGKGEVRRVGRHVGTPRPPR